MPQLQVVDLSPTPARENSLDRIMKTFEERYRGNQERNALESVYKEYEENGENIEKALKGFRTNPEISPTARTGAIKELLEVRKTNALLENQSRKNLQNAEFQRYKSEEAQAKAELAKTRLDTEKSKLGNPNRERDLLKSAGASERQIDLYEAAPVGGKTGVVRDILEENQRKTGDQEPGREGLIDFDKGLTPKERRVRENQRYNIQNKLVMDNSKMLNTLRSDSNSLDVLEVLNESEKIGKGINKFNINPQTGDLFFPQAATPEEQLFAKTINDFTVRAKDSYGGRVTNFELARFMQRLPTLANSSEGRRLILKQMKISNEISRLHNQALSDVFNEYGERKIDYPDAERLADKKIKEEVENLKNEYKNIENVSKDGQQEYITQAKKKLKPNFTLMMTPEGQIKQFPTKNVENLINLKKGYQKL